MHSFHRYFATAGLAACFVALAGCNQQAQAPADTRAADEAAVRASEIS